MPISDEEFQYLKKQKLIEGKKKNPFLSFEVAKHTDQKTDYIKNRGFKDDYYKNLVLSFIEKNGVASKIEIEKLLIDILPAILNDVQKENKVRNIIYSMSKKDGSIINTGNNRYPKWKKVLLKQ